MIKHSIERAKRRAQARQAEQERGQEIPEIRAWRYHAEHKPRIFTGEEAIAAADKDGWQDSPAKCDGFLKKIGVDPNNKLQVHFIGEVAAQTAEVMDLILNVDSLSKKQAARLAELQFSEDWSKSKKKVADLRDDLRARLLADNVIEMRPADESKPAD